ncbi:TetR family transcriptional regulator [Virgisporangium aliadipatigenens]|uniref:TetR family transcriptional regulator n=1 Tax=Virgisporangium aliadipatigenens TaxID=741659 RepID=A0A8J4DP29_9ACTN|nr:TetR family transcriptional regulator [Virgisporangium aliadipatigenens]
MAAIHAAAREAFAEQGYHATSVRDIARRAGVSMAALYYHYEGKQELLFAVLRESVEDYFVTCEHALAAAPDDPAAHLDALVGATVRYRVRRRAESTLNLIEVRNLEPRYRKLLDARVDTATRMWAGIIDDGVRAGVFATAWPDDARRAVIAMCNAIADWYRPEGAVTVDELVERYVGLARTIVACS